MSSAQALSLLHVPVADLDRAVRFYTGVFGLEVRYRADNGAVYLRIPGSTHHVALEYERATAGRGSRFGFMPSSSCDADSLIARVLALGGTLVRRRQLAPGVVEVIVADPDGNIVSL